MKKDEAVAVAVHQHSPFRAEIGGRETAIVLMFPGEPDLGYQRQSISYLSLEADQAMELRISHASAMMDIEITPAQFPYQRLGSHELEITLTPGQKVALRINGKDRLFLWCDTPMEQPLFPKRVSTVTNFGVSADTMELQTCLLQRAIDCVHQEGGGWLVFPEGVYRTGSLFIRSGVKLFLCQGAIIQGSHRREDYLLYRDAVREGLLPVANPVSDAALIVFAEATDAGLHGRGVVDGAGTLLRESWRTKGGPRINFNLIGVIASARITLSDVILRDPDFWNTHILFSQQVTCRNLKVLNEIAPVGWNPLRPLSHWNNTDGINADTSSNILIEDCLIHAGDDCLTMKLTEGAEPWRGSLQNILMRRCLLCSATGTMKIGTETLGDRICNIIFEDMDIIVGNTGRIIALNIYDLAKVENIVFRNIRVQTPAGFLDLETRPRKPGNPFDGRIRSVLIENVDLPEAGGYLLAGHQPGNDVRGIVFRNVKIKGRPAQSLEDLNIPSHAHADEISFE